MILEMLLRLVFGVVETLINLIPTITIPQPFLDAFGDVAELISYMAYFLPLKTVGICLTVIFVLQNAKFFISVFNFVIRKIPGIN